MHKKNRFCLIEEYIKEEEIVAKYLRGQYNTHQIPGGCILFKDGEDHFMECCSMQHMINKNMLDVQYIINNFPKEVKIPRSRRPEDTEDRFSIGNIIPSSASVYSTSLDTINVFVEFNDGKNGMMYKTVPLKKLMEVNGVDMLNIHPLVFQDSYIKKQTPTVQTLLEHYNKIFTEFVKNNVCSILEKDDITFTLNGCFTF